MDKEILRGCFKDDLFKGDEALYVQGYIETCSPGNSRTLCREIDGEIPEDRLEVKPVIFDGPLPISKVLTMTMSDNMVKIFIGDLRATQICISITEDSPFAVYFPDERNHIFDQAGSSHSEDMESADDRLVKLREIPDFKDKTSMRRTLLDNSQKELLDLQ